MENSTTTTRARSGEGKETEMGGGGAEEEKMEVWLFRGRREEKDEEDVWSRWCEIDLYLTGKKGKKEEGGGCVFRVYTTSLQRVVRTLVLMPKGLRGGWEYWEFLGVLARSGFLWGGGEISLWQEESGGLDGDWSNDEIP